MALDFPEFAKAHGIPYLSSGHHHCHAGWIQTHCPQCTDGSHGFHLGWSLKYGNFNCWRCGPIKTLVYLSERLRCSQERAREIAGRFSNRKRPEPRVAARNRKETVPPPGLGPLKKAHRRYLRSRGFDPDELAETWELQGTGGLSGASWNWRVCFPIKNRDGKTVSWGGRAIGNDSRKYRMMEEEKCGEDPRTMIYGIHNVPGDSVIVVEGPADVWNVGPGACGTLGIDWKVEQANQLRQFTNRFVLFDPEPKAQRKAQQLADWLGTFPGHTEIVSGIPSDPGSLPRKWIKKVRRLLSE